MLIFIYRSMPKPQQDHAVWRPLVAGGVAGATEAIITFPTDYVKTQLQLSSGGTSGVPLYKGPMDCAMQTIRSKGISALYAGVSSVIVGGFLKASVRFATYDTIKDMIIGPGKKPSSAVSILAGLAAGMTEALLAVTPTENVKIRMIQDRNRPNPQYRGLSHAFTSILRSEGPLGLYAGLLPTVMKQGLNQATRFLVYNSIMQAYERRHDSRPTWLTTVAGAIAGATSVYSTMPLDVVKTRMQGLDRGKYHHSLHCAQMVYKEGGLSAFWRGTLPRLGRVSCSASIIFFFYEQTMKLLQRVVPDKQNQL
jgi:solute carrier family 25 citrate transporter 1